ncbi:Apolipoprotein N-acyltransferase [Corynebacterium capitovis DSM 44611]|uniref:apolipoprotein N-acyltransferase n=1 Tax=Corynebacterium capitovis TaxID=131081 RepID=UPI00035D635E|nr:apolipoprotein N-acyltransferase [Corynebacterium capitovis]WKD57688.1 Apolipoprotein N-acyltransferase [Corynebacterium capitovis DSM 44611]
MGALLRLALAAVSGALVFTSYEPLGLWPLAVVGIGAFYAALMPWPAGVGSWARSNPSGRFGALLGFVHALSLYLLLLPWVGEFVGPAPFVALSITLALFSLPVGAFGVLLGRGRWGFAAFPFLYLACEYVRSSVPFGGFPWVRLAWGQIEGPLAGLAAWGGPALVTAATVAVASSAASMVLRTHRFSTSLFALVPLSLGVAASVVVSLPEDSAHPAPHEVGKVTVAAVQGNVPRMGLDFNAQRRAVLANHVAQTEALADSGVLADFVVWPENSSDVNPFSDSEASRLIDRAVDAVDVPILVGTITRDSVGARNTMVVFNPDGQAGDYHNKKYLQPFGEYMPWRGFFRRFSHYVDMAGDFKPGDGTGTVRIGGATLGIATCYEVAVDAAYRTAVNSGAQILATPTNNATFGFTDMTYQQLAMSRMRAIETDRAVVVAATSGVSAIVNPDGTVAQQTSIFEPAYLVQTLPLRDSITPAVRYGAYVQGFLVAAGAVVTMWAGMLRWGRRRASLGADIEA